MRWLLVGDGTSVHVQRMAAGLTAAGVDAHVATLAPGAAGDAQTHTLWPAGTGRARYPAAIASLRSLVRRIAPDVVNGHYLTGYGALAAFAPQGTLVQTTWGSDLLRTAQRPPMRQLARWALRRASLITGDSDDLLAAAGALAPERPRHRFLFGPPDSAWASPARPRESVVVSVRNHEPLYRIERILEAWPLVTARLPHHRLVVAGSGRLSEVLQRRAPDGVRFTGSLPHDDIVRLLGTADVVVSIPRSDATSASVLEALASGCAVVASDIPANREWVDPDLLWPAAGTPSDLADLIVRAAGRQGSLDPALSFERQVASLIDRVSSMSTT